MFKQNVLTLATTRPLEILDITDFVRSFVQSSEVVDGLLVVASPHTTMGVVVNERCDHLLKDMTRYLEKLAPPNGDYEHNRYAVDGRPNAHSHLLSLVIPSQVTLVVADGAIDLGNWQSIFAIELDGPRSARKIHLTALSS